jgi:hypothetical protein
MEKEGKTQVSKTTKSDIHNPRGVDALHGNATARVVTTQAENSALNSRVEEEGNPQRTVMMNNEIHSPQDVGALQNDMPAPVVTQTNDGKFRQQAKGNTPAAQQPSRSAQEGEPTVRIELTYPELDLLDRLLKLGYDPAWKSLTGTMQAVFFVLGNDDAWRDSLDEPVDENLPRTAVVTEPEITDEEKPF